MLFVLNRFDYIPLVYVILLTLNSNALAEVDLIEQIYHSTMNKGELNSISEMDNNYFQGEKVYLDSLEENQILSVFNKPGFDWHSCQNDGRLRASETYQKCEAVGWLDRKANVYRMAMKGQGNETYEVTQLITKYEEGFEHKVSYSYIYFRYARFYIDPKDGSWQTNEKSGYGWIPTSYLSKVFFPPFYPTINNNIVQPQNNQVVQSNAGRIEEKKNKNIQPTQKPVKDQSVPVTNPYDNIEEKIPYEEVPVIENPTIGGIKVEKEEVDPNFQVIDGLIKSQKTKTYSSSNMYDTINKIAEVIRPSVGKCFNPSGYHHTKIPFDSIILSSLKKAYSRSGEIKSLMKESDFVTIDALARTLYAEMGLCFRKGLHYPMAVARVALNRVEAAKSSDESLKMYTYVKKVNIHSNEKSLLAKIITTPSQFNLWISKENISISGQRVKTSAFHQALCPPAHSDKIFYRGYKPGLEELNIWENALKIAVETVLYPESLKKRTPKICGYNYTSGMPSFYDMRLQQPPIVEGRSLSDMSCVQLWVLPSKSNPSC